MSWIEASDAAYTNRHNVKSDLEELCLTDLLLFVMLAHLGLQKSRS